MLGSGQSDVNVIQISANKKTFEAEKEHKIPKIKFKKPKEFSGDEQQGKLVEIEMEMQKERVEQEQCEEEEAEERRIQEALERQKERRERGERAKWEESEKKKLRDERQKERRLQEENLRNFWRLEEGRKVSAEKQPQEEEMNLWAEKKLQDEETNLWAENQRQEEERAWEKKRQLEAAAAAAAKKRGEIEKKERKKVKQKERENMKMQRGTDQYEMSNRHKRQDRSMPERDRGVKKRYLETGRYSSDYSQPSKRRRGEANLSKLLETIVDKLRSQTDVSYLFLKPVSKKEAPDYSMYVSHPMDLTTIKQKVKRLDYKSRDEFRQDVALIADNAHTYNDERNPGIPPLADQLLAICDVLLDTYDEE